MSMVLNTPSPLADFDFDPEWGKELGESVPTYSVASEINPRQTHQIALSGDTWAICPVDVVDGELTLSEAILYAGELHRLITACTYLNARSVSPEDHSAETTPPDEGVAKAEWIAAHPEVRAAAPSWSNTIDILDGVHGSMAVGYEGKFGAVTLGIGWTWAHGVVRDSDRQAAVYFEDNEYFVTADDLRRYAADFNAAADALAAAERGN